MSFCRSGLLLRQVITVWTLCIIVTNSLNLPSLQSLNSPPLGNLIPPMNNSEPANVSAPLTTQATYECIGGSDYGNAINASSCLNAANGLLSDVPFSSKRFLSFKDRRGFGGTKDAEIILPYFSLSGAILFSGP